MQALKWILKDFSVSYSSNKLLYFTHCKQLNYILPIQLRFDYHDLKFLHLVFTLNLMVSKVVSLREALLTHSSTEHTLVGTGFHLPYEK